VGELRLLEERVLFSPDVPEAVNSLLQAAVVANHVDRHKAEQLFKQAQALDSDCLQTHFALYKFYFYQGRLLEAEKEVMAGLAAAALQGGFPGDYRVLAVEPGKWDMYVSDIALFYLYTLKALAFVKLRLQQEDDAQFILSLLQVLDPEDRIGSSVIMQLAQALNED
jgi:hypothetical protein